MAIIFRGSQASVTIIPTNINLAIRRLITSIWVETISYIVTSKSKCKIYLIVETKYVIKRKIKKGGV